MCSDALADDTVGQVNKKALASLATHGLSRSADVLATRAEVRSNH